MIASLHSTPASTEDALGQLVQLACVLTSSSGAVLLAGPGGGILAAHRLAALGAGIASLIADFAARDERAGADSGDDVLVLDDGTRPQKYLLAAIQGGNAVLIAAAPTPKQDDAFSTGDAQARCLAVLRDLAGEAASCLHGVAPGRLGYFAIASDGRMMLCSPRALALLELAQRGSGGRTLAEDLSACCASKVQALLSDSLRSGTAQEMPVVVRSGALRLMRWWSVGVPSRAPHPQVGMVQDLADLPSFAPALREAERRGLAQPDGGGHACFDVHLGITGADGRAWIGRGWPTLFGSSDGLALDLAHLAALVHRDDRETAAAAFAALAQAPCDLCLRLRRADGAYLRVRLRGRAREIQDGRPQRVVGSIEDCSERSGSAAIGEATSARPAPSDAVAALAQLDADLDVPLRTLRMAAETLLQWLHDIVHDEQGAAFAATFAETFAQFDRILAAHLTTARADTGQLRCVDAPFSPHELIDRVLASRRPIFAARGVRLIAVCRRDLAAPMNGDAALIAKAITEILDRALRLTPSGQITVAAGYAAQPTPEGGLLLVITVPDVGPRLTAQRRQALFVPVPHSDPAAPDAGSLAIALRLAHALGGGIDHRERPGNGNIVVLRVPLRRIRAAH